MNILIKDQHDTCNCYIGGGGGGDMCLPQGESGGCGQG